MTVKTERARSMNFEAEFQKLINERELLEETGDLAHQESAKIKHMLLMAESQLGKIYLINKLFLTKRNISQKSSCKFLCHDI